MKPKRFTRNVYPALIGALGLVSSAVVPAHHSYAMFDLSQTRTVRGAVRALEWSSPHVWLWLDVNDGKGGVTSYGFETVSPGQLQRDYGWNRHVVKPGDKVSVDYAPLRSGANGGAVETVTLPDGRVLTTRLTKQVAK